MKIIISASARFGGSNYLPPYLWWRRGAMRAGARERRRCASERPPGGVGGARRPVGGENQAAGPDSWGRRPAVGGQGAGPGGQPGGVRPLGRTVGPVAPDPAAKTGNSRRAGGCGPCPWTTYGNMATWQHGNMASVSLRRRCPSWNGEPTVNAGGEMSEIAEVGLTRHRVVASSADTVRRSFRQILAGWAIATKLCGILGRWTWTEPRFKSLHLL